MCVCVSYNSTTILLLLFLIGQLIPTVHFRYQIVIYILYLHFYGFSCLLCILQFYVIHVWECFLWMCVLCPGSLFVMFAHSERRTKGNAQNRFFFCFRCVSVGLELEKSVWVDTRNRNKQTGLCHTARASVHGTN